MQRPKRGLHVRHVSFKDTASSLLFCLVGILPLYASILEPTAGVVGNTECQLVQMHPDPEVYRQILDTALPIKLDEGGTSKFSIVLRFLPSFHPESQIVIRYDGGDTVSVEYMAAKVQLSAVLRKYFSGTRTPDIAKAATLMEVRAELLRVSTETVRDWFHEFWSSLSASAEPLERKGFAREIQVDGTQYMLQYQEGTNHLTFQYAGSELNQDVNTAGNDLPLVKWMIKIYNEVSKHVAAPRSAAGDK